MVYCLENGVSRSHLLTLDESGRKGPAKHRGTRFRPLWVPHDRVRPEPQLDFRDGKGMRIYGAQSCTSKEK